MTLPKTREKPVRARIDVTISLPDTTPHLSLFRPTQDGGAPRSMPQRGVGLLHGGRHCRLASHRRETGGYLWDLPDLFVVRAFVPLTDSPSGTGARSIIDRHKRVSPRGRRSVRARGSGAVVVRGARRGCRRRWPARPANRRAAGAATGHISPHSLRHAAITNALDAGVPLRDAKILARHADPRTTEHYHRARGNLDRHGVHFLTAYVAGV